jgi:hypothetical protein
MEVGKIKIHKTMKKFEINTFDAFVNEARLKNMKGAGSGIKSDIIKKWTSTDDITDDLRLFITAANEAGGEDLVKDIHDALRLMTNYALGVTKESVSENEVSVNPGMSVPGMGHVVTPGDNGEPGSGDRMDLGSKKKKKSEEEDEESSDESANFSPKIVNNKL